jgi:YfiH family protein
MDAEFLAEPLLRAPHGFFTRRGGVSTGSFASLNCSLGGRDDPAAVAENRRRAMVAIGATPGQLSGLHQVHGTVVVEVSSPIPITARPQGDAMVSRTPGQVLGIVTGDCVPVLFLDAAAGVAGACHAGWRGAVAGVLEATLTAMSYLGGYAGTTHAVVGPCIRQPSYEVAADLRDAVLAREAADACFFLPGREAADGPRWQFDLAGYCAARLRAAGASVSVIDADTLAEEARFFSHRRATLAGGGPIGHQLSAIQVPG